MYQWRKLTPDQRSDLLSEREENLRPWHSVPHRVTANAHAYVFTAACYEHKAHIGFSPRRMKDFEAILTTLAEENTNELIAWVILPNHYHFLSSTTKPLPVLRKIGKLHGRTSFEWNGEESTRGRKVWSGAAETAMKSEGHYWATINYIHHNPVRHGYVEKWQEWPYSSAHQYLESIGDEKARRIWKEYPVKKYGQVWDEL